LYSNISKYILNHTKLFFSVILFITSIFFYVAFLSDDKLKIDFSLEQMFPTKDEDRDDYEQFKIVYGREDNVMFMTVTNGNIFSDINLSILELLTADLSKIKHIDYAFSLGSLWDDGDGKIGYDYTYQQRYDKIITSNLYSDLISNDSKSTLIVIGINEDIYSHETRKQILIDIDKVVDSFKFDLTSFESNVITFNNSNILSEYSSGPYSVIQSVIDDIYQYNDETKILGDNLNINSINDCYEIINKDSEVDIPLTLELINKNCDNPILISRDLKSTKLIFNTNVDISRQVINDLTKVIENNEYIKYSSWDWHEAGLPILRTRYVELVEYERGIFIPIAFIIAAITLIWIFRQIRMLIIALTSILISLIWVSGIMALFNISINVISYLTFNLLMIIGVSDAIHLLMKYHEEINKNSNKRSTLKVVIEKIGSALFLTSFTTAVGFMSLSITNIRILQEFGVIMGVGIGILFIITIIIMPIMLLYINIPDKIHIERLILKRKKSLSFQSLKAVQKYPKVVISLSGFLLILSIYGIYQIDSNVTVLGDLKPSNKLYKDISFVEDNFGGTLPLEIIISSVGTPLSKDLYIKTNAVNTIDNSDFYNKVNLFMRDLTNYENIKSVTGYWNLDGSLNAQQKKYTNKDRTEIRISCGIENIDSNQADWLKKSIIKDYINVFDTENGLKVTGSTLLALKMNRYLIASLLNSFIIAFIVIFISMNILFRSIKLSLVSIIPNIIPLLFAGAVMGFFGIELRPATAMTFSIALGIAVDDTIHFLSRFRSEYLITRSHEKSTTTTILTTGRAIIGTSITLGMGFLVLIFSNFKPNFEFGILATIILIVALLSSLILLPALINLIKPLNKSYE
tara:strand:- start:4841 stop:7417 length:2577 start_codon:yes stop_codon:yes gene_type:complete